MSLKSLPSFGLNTTVAKTTFYFDEPVPRVSVTFFILCCRGGSLSLIFQMDEDRTRRSPCCGYAKIWKTCNANEQS